ncbi:MAG: DNA-3-methyladenine glycosylase [Lachnospiraceae bacterium]|nr:DNA-3-methyladenine glycosylase [Lachnospiraceae bacterium]
MKVTGITDFDLAQTLDCGQAFRWAEQPDGAFIGVAHGKILTLRKNGDELELDGVEPSEYDSIWKRYFDLDMDYGAVRTELSKLHPILNEAAEFAPGIRILNQEPWEALCSFIISQNNNIPRIKGIIERLCAMCGEQLADNMYTFPSAEKIAAMTAEDLAPIRAGFRARYIIDGARRVADGSVDLEKIRTMPIDEARKELMQITGVGVKVADCTLLYGLHRLDCFPLDVWMKRAMSVLFPSMTATDFGEYGGIAQQYIFHYSRLHPELFE